MHGQPRWGSGPEKGFEVANRNALAVAFMFLNDEGVLVERRTSPNLLLRLIRLRKRLKTEEAL